MKKTLMPIFIILFFVYSNLSFCGEKSVTVFAAASTTDAMQELAKKFKSDTGITVKLNFASSGNLARQLEQGAPGEVYISASKKWADYALKKKLIMPDSAKNFLSNGLVVIVPLDSRLKPFKITKNLDFPSLFKGRISIGDPAHVPAGKYADAALKYYGWDKPLRKRILPAMDVRSALLTVEMGEAELGIVYSTDAEKSKKVKVVSVFPSESYPEIVYVCGLCLGAGKNAHEFMKCMLGSSGMGTFKKCGFIPLVK
jgi:molybdate transport system substrate-binding protein